MWRKIFGNDEDHDQSNSCNILSLLDSYWRTLEFKMNLPRIKTGVFTEGSKVIVMGGTTSNINSETGCRETQEVFDREKPSGGWVFVDMEENVGCHRSEGQRKRESVTSYCLQIYLVKDS